MPRLYSSRYIIAVLQKHGFIFVSQRGSHIKFHKTEIGTQTKTVIIPANKKEIPFGTFRSIARQAGLTKEDFK